MCASHPGKPMCLGGYEYLCVVLNISCVEKNKNIKRRGGGGGGRGLY